MKAQQGRVKIIPWDFIEASKKAAQYHAEQEGDEDDIFSFESKQDTQFPTLALPQPLATKLFAHQTYGVNWMFNLFSSGGKGGILADDMGLGKVGLNVHPHHLVHI